MAVELRPVPNQCLSNYSIPLLAVSLSLERTAFAFFPQNVNAYLQYILCNFSRCVTWKQASVNPPVWENFALFSQGVGDYTGRRPGFRSSSQAWTDHVIPVADLGHIAAGRMIALSHHSSIIVDINYVYYVSGDLLVVLHVMMWYPLEVN
jgi:hypothetical protein